MTCGTPRRSIDLRGQLSDLRRIGHCRHDRDSSRVVYPIQKHWTLTLLQILVDGLANPYPIAIVVDDEDPTSHEPRGQVDQLVLRGLVPVGIQAKESNLLGRVLGHGLFDSPLDKWTLSSG
jgi:hypothetical protein